VDLELEPTRTLGLVGPNGSGKSTLLKIAAGIEEAEHGSARVFGHPPRALAARRRIGYLPERSPFPPELSAERALALLASLHGMEREERRRRGHAMLERVGLGAQSGKPLGRYSRGMLRRFALAQAFLHRPDLLLLDEPSAGLDARGFLVLAELLEEAHARGAAIVICSHHLADLFGQAETLAVLIDGSIVRQGPLHELVTASERDSRGADALLELYRSHSEHAPA
jgi:ABC-type multidrug transport system ATPase subunit